MPVPSQDLKTISDVVESKRDEIIEFLRTLIRTRSYTGEEGEAQSIVRGKLENFGMTLDVFEPDREQIRKHPAFVPIEISEKIGYKNRPNVVGKLMGTGNGRSIILFTHIDTVPTGSLDKWSHDPFAGEIDGGRMYGRGTADNKGGITIMLMALQAIIEAKMKLKGDITIASVIEEEAGGSGGALALVLRGYRADGSIYPHPEQSGLAVMAAQAGGIAFKVKVTGKMIHGHSAHLGINAIGKMFKIYQSLMDLDQYRRLTVRYPLFENYFRTANMPSASTNIVPAIIKAGEWAYQVPNECELICSMGFPPGEQIDDLKALIEDCIRKTAESDPWLKDHLPEVEWIGWKCEPSETNVDHPLVGIMQHYLREVAGIDRPPLGTPSFGDMRFMIKYGKTPTVMLGPRGGSLHGADEWVDLNELITAVKVVALSILDFCGYER